MQKIQLGATYHDRITGFAGVATGFVQYITGCNQVLLAPRTDDPSKLPEPQWFDVQRVILSANIGVVELDNSTTTGFDRMAPKR